jgi:hypothetical protein
MYACMIYKYVHTYVCMHVCMYARIHHVFSHASTYTYIQCTHMNRTHTYAHTHTHTHTHIYIYTHTHTQNAALQRTPSSNERSPWTPQTTRAHRSGVKRNGYSTKRSQQRPQGSERPLSRLIGRSGRFEAQGTRTYMCCACVMVCYNCTYTLV